MIGLAFILLLLAMMTNGQPVVTIFVLAISAICLFGGDKIGTEVK